MMSAQQELWIARGKQPASSGMVTPSRASAQGANKTVGFALLAQQKMPYVQQCRAAERGGARNVVHRYLCVCAYAAAAAAAVARGSVATARDFSHAVLSAASSEAREKTEVLRWGGWWA